MPVDATPYSHDGLAVAALLQTLAEVTAAELTNTPTGLPDEMIVGYVHGRPIEDTCSALNTWIQYWIPHIPAEFPNDAQWPTRHPVEMSPVVMVSLRRPCAPTEDDDGHVLADVEQAFAQALAVDFRAIVAAVASQWPATIRAAGYPVGSLAYGRAMPVGDNSECLGWDWPVTIRLPGCQLLTTLDPV